jgi:mannonate dehydratase
MKVVERLVLDSSLTDENMVYLKQLGIEHLTVAFLEMGTREPPGKSTLSGLRENACYALEDLVAVKQWVESRGLKLSAVGSPSFRHWEKIFFGLPGRDEQIENWIKTIRNLGKAGIPILQNTWVLNAGATIPLWRTSAEKVGRGGTEIVRFDNVVAQQAPVTKFGTLSEDDAWANLSYFLKAVIPVAEESGVTLTLHPVDPQVPSIAGIARPVRSVAAYERLFSMIPSKALQMTFCLGCFTQMLPPAEVYRTIRHFGRQGRIGYVHFRGIRGSIEKFDEVFPDEGDLDMVEAMRALHESGFRGAIQPDHAPHTTGDSEYGHISHAFQIGYLKGVLQGAGALQ